MTAIAIGESTSLVNFNVIFYKRAERLNFCIFFYFLCETIYKRLIPAFQCVAVKHHQMNFLLYSTIETLRTIILVHKVSLIVSTDKLKITDHLLSLVVLRM